MDKIWSAQWHITTKCDQRCQHCYLFNSPEAKTEINGEGLIGWPELQNIADDIKTTADAFGAGCVVSLTGGDPILHPYFWQLLDYLKHKEIAVNILGNPFHIDNVSARQLKDSGIRMYQLSIDGMRDKHDQWRKIGSFERTLEAVQTLKSQGVKVSIMTTVSKDNAADIPSVIKLSVEKLEVNTYSFARFVPKLYNQTEMFTPREYREFLARIWDVYSQYPDAKTKITLKDHLWKLFLYEEGLYKPEPTDIVMAGCGMGINHLTILANGEVYACRRFPSPIGRVPQEKLYDIFTKGKIYEYREVEEKEKCKDCFLFYYCRGCPAVSYSQSGNWKSPDPQCWLQT